MAFRCPKCGRFIKSVPDTEDKRLEYGTCIKCKLKYHVERWCYITEWEDYKCGIRVYDAIPIDEVA